MNRRVIQGLVGLVLALCCIPNAHAQEVSQQVDANRQRAAMLWEEAIRAKGGRERLHSIESLVISSGIWVEAERGGGETKTERLYAMPNKAWIHEFTEHQDVSLVGTVINNEIDLCLVTLAPVGPMGSVPPLTLCLPTTWSEQLIQEPFIYLMETKWVRPMPVGARIEGQGRKQHDVVEIELGKLRVDIHLDRKTHLPTKLVMDQYYPSMSLIDHKALTIKLDDYVAVDGVQMPRLVTREPDVGPQIVRRDTERTRYKFNVAYDEAIFNRPVSKRAKSDDWKAKKDRG